jgi:hypothetical protein
MHIARTRLGKVYHLSNPVQCNPTRSSVSLFLV